MFMTLKKDRSAIDARGGTPKTTKIPMGRHEVRRIRNPLGGESCPWLVLKGTFIGGPEESWRQWQNGIFQIQAPGHERFGKPVDWGDDEVIIEG